VRIHERVNAIVNSFTLTALRELARSEGFERTVGSPRQVRGIDAALGSIAEEIEGRGTREKATS
jgi:hypothetical protein